MNNLNGKEFSIMWVHILLMYNLNLNVIIEHPFFFSKALVVVGPYII